MQVNLYAYNSRGELQDVLQHATGQGILHLYEGLFDIHIQSGQTVLVKKHVQCTGSHAHLSGLVTPVVADLTGILYPVSLNVHARSGSGALELVGSTSNQVGSSFTSLVTTNVLSTSVVDISLHYFGQVISLATDQSCSENSPCKLTDLTRNLTIAFEGLDDIQSQVFASSTDVVPMLQATSSNTAHFTVLASLVHVQLTTSTLGEVSSPHQVDCQQQSTCAWSAISSLHVPFMGLEGVAVTVKAAASGTVVAQVASANENWQVALLQGTYTLELSHFGVRHQVPGNFTCTALKGCPEFENFAVTLLVTFAGLSDANVRIMSPLSEAIDAPMVEVFALEGESNYIEVNALAGRYEVTVSVGAASVVTAKPVNCLSGTCTISGFVCTFVNEVPSQTSRIALSTANGEVTSLALTSNGGRISNRGWSSSQSNGQSSVSSQSSESSSPSQSSESSSPSQSSGSSESSSSESSGGGGNDNRRVSFTLLAVTYEAQYLDHRQKKIGEPVTWSTCTPGPRDLELQSVEMTEDPSVLLAHFAVPLQPQTIATDCALTFTNQNLGAGATCRVIAPHIVRIDCSEDATILPGDTVTVLMQYVTVAAPRTGLLHGAAPLTAPNGVPSVSITLLAPTTVSAQAEHILLDATQSQGRGGRPMTYLWRVEPEGTVTIEGVSQIFMPTLSLRGPLPLLGDPITVTLTVTNAWGMHATRSHTLQVVAEPCLPTLTVDVPDLLEIAAGTMGLVPLTAAVQVPASCQSPAAAAVNVSWSQRSGPALPSDWNVDSSSSSSSVWIDRSSLIAGSEVVLVVTAQVDQVQVERAITVRILPVPPLIILRGGNAQVGERQGISLNAAASLDLSSHASGTSGLSFSWHCQQVRRGLPCLTKRGELAETTTNTGSSLSLSRRDALPLGAYLFTLTARSLSEDNAAHVASHSVWVTVVKGNIPAHEVVVGDLKQGSQVLADQLIRLTGHALTGESSLASLRWSATVNGQHDWPLIPGQTILTEPDTGVLVLQREVLLPHVTYVFTLTVTEHSGRRSSSQATLTPVLLPFGGNLAVNPTAGVFLQDTFTLSLSGWQAVSVGSPARRLTFAFAVEDESGEELPLSTAHSGSLWHVYLPAGAVTVKGTVTDLEGATTQVLQPVTVARGGSNPLIYHELQDWAEVKLSAAVEQQDLDEVVDVIASMQSALTLLNGSMDTTAIESQMMTALLQLQSVVRNPNDVNAWLSAMHSFLQTEQLNSQRWATLQAALLEWSSEGWMTEGQALDESLNVLSVMMAYALDPQISPPAQNTYTNQVVDVLNNLGSQMAADLSCDQAASVKHSGSLGVAVRQLSGAKSAAMEFSAGVFSLADSWNNVLTSNCTTFQVSLLNYDLYGSGAAVGGEGESSSTESSSHSHGHQRRRVKSANDISMVRITPIMGVRAWNSQQTAPSSGTTEPWSVSLKHEGVVTNSVEYGCMLAIPTDSKEEPTWLSGDDACQMTPGTDASICTCHTLGLVMVATLPTPGIVTSSSNSGNTELPSGGLPNSTETLPYVYDPILAVVSVLLVGFALCVLAALGLLVVLSVVLAARWILQRRRSSYAPVATSAGAASKETNPLYDYQVIDSGEEVDAQEDESLTAPRELQRQQMKEDMLTTLTVDPAKKLHAQANWNTQNALFAVASGVSTSNSTSSSSSSSLANAKPAISPYGSKLPSTPSPNAATPVVLTTKKLGQSAYVSIPTADEDVFVHPSMGESD